MELALVAVVDLIAIIGLLSLAYSKGGLERALPFATFLIVLVPIESLVPMGFFTLTTHRLVIGVLFVLYLVRGNGPGQTELKSNLPLKGLIFLHVIWCLVATTNSIVPTMSVKKLISVVLEYYLLYFIFYKTITKTQTVQKVLIAIALAIGVCSVLGTFEAYRGWNVLDYFPSVGHHFDVGTGGDREDRIHSTYDHAILFGAALATAITIGLYLLSVVRRQSHTILLWVGLMLMFLNIYKTSSRGPWIDAIIGCSLLMVFGQGRTRKALLCIMALSLAVLILRPGIRDTITGIYESTFGSDATGSSYRYRYALQDAAVKRLTSPTSGRTAWGYGPESFFDVHLEGTLDGKPHEFLSCDNAWVELLVETGFVGLAIIAALLIIPLLVSLRQCWALPQSQRGLSFLLFINFVMCYFQMYSVGMYSWGQNGYMLWIMIALTFAHQKLQDQAEGTSGKRSEASAGTNVTGTPAWIESEWWEMVGEGRGLQHCSLL
jgi:hypothetical protein